MNEAEIQKTVAETLDYQPGVVWFHCPNERKVPVQRMVKLKKHGLKPGIPDCLIITPAPANNRPSALELKAEGNDLTENQERWLETLYRLDWNAEYTVGLDESLQQLRDWGYLN